MTVFPSPPLVADPPPAPARPGSAQRWSLEVPLVAICALGLWGVLCWRLAGEWSISEQYAYGWLVPFLALALFGLRWETRPILPRPQEAPPLWRGVFFIGGGFLLFLLLPIRLFEDANPDWRLLGWLHTGAVVGLTMLWLCAKGGARWLRHFAFPVGFFFVAVPWIKSHEELVVGALMRAAAAAATDGLGVLGIPAQLEGSLIRLSTGVVGVNEACSGVRGLQTSLMIGLLIGELQRLSPWRRVTLVTLAVGLALTANIVRAFSLVWLAARHGLGAAERGHDIAGYTILGVVFVGTVLLAAWLKRGMAGYDRGLRQAEAEPVVPETSPRTCGRRALPHALIAGALTWVILVEVAVEGWYRWHERGLIARPQWAVRWPDAATGFRELPIDERTRWLLHFDVGRAASWRLMPAPGSEGTLNAALPTSLTAPASPSAPPPPASSCLAYFFRWKPGRNSVRLAGAHRPDVCLPASGWTQTADYGVQFYRLAVGRGANDPADSLRLPFRHFAYRRDGSSSPGTSIVGPGAAAAHVFYCLWEDRAVPALMPADEPTARPPTPVTRASRWDPVRDGRRHLGQQVLEVALLAPGVDAAEAERLFAGQLNSLIVSPTTERK